MTLNPRLNPHVRAARDFLLLHRADQATATAGFTWPELPTYNDIAVRDLTVGILRCRCASHIYQF